MCNLKFIWMFVIFTFFQLNPKFTIRIYFWTWVKYLVCTKHLIVLLMIWWVRKLQNNTQQEAEQLGSILLHEATFTTSSFRLQSKLYLFISK